MIKRIPEIVNMGAFKEFNWDRDVRDRKQDIMEFKKRNIIYGRNYTGKTTLSRVIRAYEIQEMPANYKKAAFKLHLDGDGIIASDQLAEHTQEFRVFNKDFIKDNLCFLIDETRDIEVFALTGKENIDIQNKIKEIKKVIGERELSKGIMGDMGRETDILADLRNTLQKKEGELQEQLRHKANRDIKENRKYRDVRYNINKIKADIEIVLGAGFTDITPDRVEKYEGILSEKPKDPIKNINIPDPNIEWLIERIKELVERKIEIAKPIQGLVVDHLLETWARQGINLHRNKYSRCGFCNAPLSDDLFERLDGHFNEKSEALRRELEEACDIIDKTRNSQSMQIIIKPSDFYLHMKEEVEALSVDWKTFANELDKLLENLRGDVEARIASISTPIDFKPKVMPSFKLKVLQDRYNKAIENHDEFDRQLKGHQGEARTKLRLHEIKKFLDIIKYKDKMNDINGLKEKIKAKEKTISSIENKLDKYKSKIKKLEAKIIGEEAAKDQINLYLHYHLGHDALSLECIKDEEEGKGYKFEIRRHGRAAYNLSEGEKSLVAFCYFLAKLKDIPMGKKPIIWIDDPICSLDDNHIFYIFGLIESEIIRTNNYKQLFISTHNLDFLKYLLRIEGSKLCLMLELGKEKVFTKEMPKHMEEFATEFNYLFSQIVSAANSEPASSDECLAFPNDARKFLELFLRFKYPNPLLKEIKLYEKFFKNRDQDFRTVNRLINEASHFRGRFEKALRPICRPEQKKIATTILCNICFNDRDQFDALMNSVGYKKRDKRAPDTCLRRSGNTESMCYF